VTADTVDIQNLLRRPVGESTSGGRLADILGGQETAAYAALSVGDIVYDRVSIDPNALAAFHFVKKPTEADIYKLATWSREIEHSPGISHEGSINWLKGSVFEQVAATSLRQSGAHVVFPTSASNPGWDFLVNGERVQAKCGIGSDLVTKHLHRYPDIPKVVVSENLARHFSGNESIIPIPGASEEAIRATTEHSLHSAANLLELHLLEIVPVVLVARNAYAWWRGQTDWAAIAQNLALDGPTRWAGAKAGHIGGLIVATMMGGWPAVLLPVATSVIGFRAGRGLADHLKQKVLLRSEYATLLASISSWCRGAVDVLDRAMAGAAHEHNRFVGARASAPAAYSAMIDDWLERLAREQADRRYHRDRFARAAEDPKVLGQDLDPVSLAASAVIAGPRAGILAFDLVSERKQLVKACEAYANGLKKHLLRR